MASTSLFLPTVPNFSEDNYNVWAIKMKRCLIANDLWDIVDKGFQAPAVDAQLTEEQQKIYEKNSSKDAKALFVLQSAVSDKIFQSIMDATTAKQAWDILENQSEDKKEVIIDWMESMRAMQHHSGEKSNISNKSAVPEKLRKENDDSYKPKVVSIGPRFRGSTRDLLKMEKTKWEYMSSLLDRVQGNAERNLAMCGELILGLEKEVRASYVDDLKQMTWRDIANVMLYDACFIIELRKGQTYSLQWEVLSDLMVLDNQIPFFVLRKLYCQLFDETVDSIETLALELFGYRFNPGYDSIFSYDTKNASNLVDLVQSYISMDLKDGHESNQLILEIRGNIKPAQLDRCATMLRAAGVKIIPRDFEYWRESWSFDFRLRFNSSCGTLDIPHLFITESTKARWLNLIAWEHHKMEASGTSETFQCKCTSAALFFNALICCESDVQLLKDMNIIDVDDDMRMSNKDLVTFFRSIIRGINQDKIDSRYNVFHFDDLNKYYSHPARRLTQIPQRFWHYLTGFPREALRDLLNFLNRGYNFTAAVITILSLLQTIYAVLSYYHPKK